MSKKSLITSVLQNNVPDFAACFFPLGGKPLRKDGSVCMVPGTEDEDAIEAFPEVREIMFCKHDYGKGAKVNEPCYVIKFTEGDQKVIIPATKYCQITIASVEEAPVPNMPE